MTKNKRKAVYSRDSFRCCKCGLGEELTVDHIVPISLKGCNGLKNMQTLCWDCNQQKGGKIKIYNNRKKSLNYVHKMRGKQLNRNEPKGSYFNVLELSHSQVNHRWAK